MNFIKNFFTEYPFCYYCYLAILPIKSEKNNSYKIEQKKKKKLMEKKKQGENDENAGLIVSPFDERFLRAHFTSAKGE